MKHHVSANVPFHDSVLQATEGGQQLGIALVQKSLKGQIVPGKVNPVPANHAPHHKAGKVEEPDTKTRQLHCCSVAMVQCKCVH